MTAPAATTATIIPCLRYRDAHAAIVWLPMEGCLWWFSSYDPWADPAGGA